MNGLSFYIIHLVKILFSIKTNFSLIDSILRLLSNFFQHMVSLENKNHQTEIIFPATSFFYLIRFGIGSKSPLSYTNSILQRSCILFSSTTPIRNDSFITQSQGICSRDLYPHLRSESLMYSLSVHLPRTIIFRCIFTGKEVIGSYHLAR